MASSGTGPSITRTAERVALAAGDGLYVGGAPVDGLAGRTVTAVAPDRDALWVVAERRDLYRVHGGRAELVASLDSPVAVCVHSFDGRVLAGGDDAGLWELVEGELHPVRSFAQAPTRTDWHTPWGGPPSVFSMAAHGFDLYVSVHVGGILRSEDGARTWVATIDLYEDVHQVVVDPDSATVWAATGTSGLAESTDRGRTWTHHTDGLHATYLLAAAVTSAGVLVAASSGHAGRDGVVYLFDGTSFHRPVGLPDPLGGAVHTRHLTGGGDSAAMLTPDGSLYASDDGGRSWQRAGGPFPSPAEVRMTASTAA